MNTRAGADAPDWYREALAVPRRDETVEVDGCLIHYLAWGERERPGIVFVHGGGAHAHWWTHVAARYAARCRVAAIDLSGHGDSDRRKHYSLEGWTDEVMAVASDAGMSGAPVIVGHSMGGFVTIATAALHSEELAGVVICDSPISKPDPEVDAHRIGEAFGKPRSYASRKEALERLRTVPPQDYYLDYVMADVGFHSLRESEGGWCWKFDHLVFSAFEENPRAAARPYLADVSCRLALLRSECGLVTEDIGTYMYEQLGRVSPVIEIPLAGHHLMLDQPLLLITALNTLLADWDHSEPRKRDG
ncbi:MAG: alpha/beta hydrolase [Deltaproteobacteria bacterium]|jgi:pimeloyl-ACP methyl ester carboxylesterase|nr:alpha/beta hydrolase [Deltaproteobacteria bacterium]